MDIVIFKNGRKHGPFSEENVIAFLESGRLLASDLGWRQGVVDWTPLSQLLGSVIAHIPSPPPGTPPAIQHVPGVYSTAEILRIAQLQKRLIWVVVASFAAILNLWVAIGVAIITVVFVFQLARALRMPAWLYAIGALVPLVSLFMLLALNSDATAALRKKGLRVGLMGAKERDLDRLKAPRSLAS